MNCRLFIFYYGNKQSFYMNYNERYERVKMNKKKILIVIIAAVIIVAAAVMIGVFGKKHQYFCDKFMLTVDDKQYDLKQIEPAMSSVSELLPITRNHLFILGRIDESNNALIIYDFKKDEFVFTGQGTTMCWLTNRFKSVRYLKDNVVYDLNGNVVYEGGDSRIITMIEYWKEDFKISTTDLNHENPKVVWIEK